MAANRQAVLYFLLILIPFVWSSSQRNILSADDVLTISSNRTIISPGDIFELGFFKLAGPDAEDGDRWYLGMWYKATSTRYYVWVANRDHPLSSSNGSLKISNSSLVLVDQSGDLVWSSNSSALVHPSPRSPVVAELLGNGNFVLRHNYNRDSSFIWESFQFPTDTLLPGMKIGLDSTTGVDTMLTSWKSADDPSIGPYSYKINIEGLPQMFLWNATSPLYRSTLGTLGKTTYVLLPISGKNLHLQVTYIGMLQKFSWSPTTQHRDLIWSAPSDSCDYYGKICGSNSFCGLEGSDMHPYPKCECFTGFQKRFPRAWWFRDMTNGCKRKTPLSCNANGFDQLKNVKLPDTKEAIVERSIGLEECKQRCLKDCYCTGFANVDTDCLMYRGEFVDTQILVPDGQDLYVKVANVDLGFSGKGRRKGTKITSLIIAGIIVTVITLLTFAMFWWCWKRKEKQTREIARNTDLVMNGDKTDLVGANEELTLPRMEYATLLEATDDFCNSNKLGQGGFGVVYKGRLTDGREIAVKRLSKVSNEGTSQFLNEVNLISKLQHINLVRLVGFSIHGEDHILVYEYLENLSLDFYLFGNSESSRLTWPTRYEIIDGIARGLTYLHQDSYFRIIHRDLKASNILLDKDMIAKISDFGMARLVGRDETQTNTGTLEGTFGYMSPEYIRDLVFSDKSDVFSFGVLVLELLSGKRNCRFLNSEGDTSLLSCVWRNWEEGSFLEIVDPFIADSLSSPSRVLQIVRCVQIGLLCVQERAEDRPKMSSVVVMLESATALPPPKPPGHCDPYAHTSLFETGSTSTGPPADDECNIPISCICGEAYKN